MAIDNQVLDLSPFTSHPGGSTYVPFCGTDATQAFNTKGGGGSPHSSTATAMFAQYLIGTLGSTITITPTPIGATPTPVPSATPRNWEIEDD